MEMYPLYSALKNSTTEQSNIWGAVNKWMKECFRTQPVFTADYFLLDGATDVFTQPTMLLKCTS